ncbi:MAG: NAD(+)/NADH kinase [Candidatus Verstraetearchaeota archaeon]|nr:NAD(+)/NADH kinase [Candidatus Verstraetearchaeota archaeon]
MMKLRTIIIHKQKSQEAEKISRNIGNYLELNNISVKYVVLDDIDKIDKNDADLVIVVGGDGTIIRTIHKVEEIPILGIKYGAIGFLCETTPENAKNTIDKILAGNYYLDKRTLLNVEYLGKNYTVVNEVLLTASKISKIISFSIFKNEKLVYSGKADGIIVSTVTGSTAYAFSAGGCIIDPELDLIEVIMICPLSIVARPFLFPISCKLKILLQKNDYDGLLIVDGDEVCKVNYDEPIKIEKSNKSALFIRTEPFDFYKRIKEKIALSMEK